MTKTEIGDHAPLPLSDSTSRRKFLKSTAVAIGGLTLPITAHSYAQIIGANDRVNFGIAGLNSRAYAHLASLQANEYSARITHVADVDAGILDKFAAAARKATDTTPARHQDFRRMLESKDIDAITIATPDHWHTPMAIYALQAGKHVYVEKPCSHNLHECELLVQAQRKYGKRVQMGNQQRSSPHTIEIIGRIHSGRIGHAYFAKAWYSNSRATIGIGKTVPIPANLDWELWQGPAPRQPYKDNLHPYNWHWFRNYGTGEALNNGTHEVDICRWALDATYPDSVTASGGRYQFNDDWQFYDTLVTSFQFHDKLISWENMSSNGMSLYNRDRGAAIHGTEGTVIVDRDGYEIHDLKGKLTEKYVTPKGTKATSADIVGVDDMTDLHFTNFIDAIRTGTQLHSPIEQARISVDILLMSNIAWQLNRALAVNPTDGSFPSDPEAVALRTRAYEKGWEPQV